MNRTGIEWARLGLETGWTWNPVVGCSHGCPYCYARGMAKRVAGVTGCQDCATFTPHLHPERLCEPTRRQKPAGIFVGSMTDLWDPNVKREWRDQVCDAMLSAPWHRYAMLTKRPDLMEKYALTIALAGCVELVVGVSVTRQPELWRCRDLDRAWRGGTFLSIEPLLEPIEFPVLYANACWMDWIVVGAETGNRPGRVEPKPEWIEEIVEAADRAGQPLFMKDNLRPYLPAGMELRQEWPRRWDSVSEVRGRCVFCADRNHARVHPPCVYCADKTDKPYWSPSDTGRIALRLESDLAAARAQVQRVREALSYARIGTQDYLTGMLALARDIRAALDPPADPEVGTRSTP